MKGCECRANDFEFCFLNSGAALTVCDQENGVSKSNQQMRAGETEAEEAGGEKASPETWWEQCR